MTTLLVTVAATGLAVFAILIGMAALVALAAGRSDDFKDEDKIQEDNQ